MDLILKVGYHPLPSIVTSNHQTQYAIIATKCVPQVLISYSTNSYVSHQYMHEIICTMYM